MPLLLLVAACAGAPPRGPVVATTTTAFTLPSGMRVVLAEVPGLDRFALALSQGAGAADDPAGEDGLAHLTEHLVFRARPSVGGPTLGARLAATGWRWNAFTSHDQTSYVTSGPASELGAALELEAARVRDPLAGVEARDLEVERDVVLAELRERFESDEGELAALVQAAFSGHRYGRPPGGEAATLGRVTLDGLRAWVRAHYLPERAVLAIASPLPAAEVAALLRAAFGEEPRGVAEGARDARVVTHEARAGADHAREPAPALPGARGPPTHLRAPVERPRVWVGWPVPGRWAPDALHPDLLVSVLEAATGEELKRHWIADHVVSVDGGFLDVDAAGLLWVRVEIDDESVATRAADAVRTAGRELGGRYRIARELVQRVADRSRVAGLLDLEELDGVALARHLRLTGEPDLLGAGARRDAARLREPEGPYARRYLGPERSAVVVAAPDRNVAARALAPPPRRAPRAFDEGEDAPPAPPEAARAASASGPRVEVERRTLANGLDVVLARRGTLPLAEVRLAIRTRAQGTPEVPPGLPSLALAHATTQLARARAASVGAHEALAVAAEQVVLRVRGASASLDVLLEAAARWAKEQRLGAPELEAAQRFMARRLHWYRGEAPERAWRLLEARIFPGHPYGAHATPEGIARLDAGDAERWLRTQLRPQRATLVVVSDQAPSPRWWSAVEREFGGWGRGGAEREPALPAPALPDRRTVTLLERPGATEAVVLVGVREPPVAERDAAAASAARAILAARLERRLRAEGGATYGVHVVPVERARAAAVVVAVRVAAAEAGDTARAVLDAIDALGREPPDPVTAARARLRVARSVAQRFETVSSTALALQELAARGADVVALRREVAEDAAALTPERVRSAAAALATGREVIVVVGDAARVRAPLEAAGLAPAEQRH